MQHKQVAEKPVYTTNLENTKYGYYNKTKGLNISAIQIITQMCTQQKLKKNLHQAYQVA